MPKVVYFSFKTFFIIEIYQTIVVGNRQFRGLFLIMLVCFNHLLELECLLVPLSKPWMFFEYHWSNIHGLLVAQFIQCFQIAIRQMLIVWAGMLSQQKKKPFRASQIFYLLSFNLGFVLFQQKTNGLIRNYNQNRPGEYPQYFVPIHNLLFLINKHEYRFPFRLCQSFCC